MRRRVGGAHRLLARAAGDRRPPRRRAGARRAVRPRAGDARRVARLDLRRRLAPRRRACCAAPRSGTAPGARAPWPSSRPRRTSRPTPPARACRAACGPSAARVWVDATCPARRCAPASSPPPRSRSPLGDECVGVIELYASDVREPNAEVSAMFATVGGQLAAYLARRRVRARARRSFDGAGALVVALDADGRVEIANGTACAALGLAEDELLGRDWFAAAVAEPERAAARAALRAPAGRRARPRCPADARACAWRWSLVARRRRRADRRARLGRAGARGRRPRRAGQRLGGARPLAMRRAALAARDRRRSHCPRSPPSAARTSATPAARGTASSPSSSYASTTTATSGAAGARAAS